MSETKLTKYPGPRSRLLSTWKILRDPYSAYQEWGQKYGDTYLVKAMNGDVVVTSNTENIRNVYAARSEAVGQFAIGTLEPLLGARSVILSDGESHRQQRKLLMPSFHGELISGQEEVIQQVARKVSRPWKSGETVRVMDFSLAVSLEVIIRVVFGITDDESVERLKKNIVKFVKAFHPLLAFTKLLHRPLFGLSPWNRFSKVKDESMEMLQKEIDARRSSGVRGDDLLSRLLDAEFEDGRRMEDAQIRAQLVTMLFAGHETTQIAIAWAMSWLTRHPDIEQRLRAELQSDTLQSVVRHSKLLAGVCNESLRLNPIVPDTIRVLKQPLEFSDRVLPPGTNVAMIACQVHHSAEIYSEPERFDPDRWSEKSFKPHEFFPFGGGVRRCIGATLAILEMKVVLATWLTHFKFSLPDSSPEKELVHRRNLVMAPVSGVLLKVDRI